jgi:hypothetical protein
MAELRCKKCNASYMTGDQRCLSCGEITPPPSQSMAPLVILVLILVGGVWSWTSIFNNPTATPTTNPSNISSEPRNQAAKDSVVSIFKSDEEPTARDAIWTSDSMFKVGVIDTGSSRNGYASYVCEVLREHGLSSGHFVEVVDIVSISRGGAWTVLGDARC